MNLTEKTLTLMQGLTKLTEEGKIIWERQRGGKMVATLDGIGDVKVTEYFKGPLPEGEKAPILFVTICDASGHDLYSLDNDKQVTDDFKEALEHLCVLASTNSAKTHGVLDGMLDKITASK